MEEWIRLAREGDGVGLFLAFGRAIYPAALFSAYRDALAAAGEGVTREELARFVILAEGSGDGAEDVAAGDLLHLPEDGLGRLPVLRGAAI